MRGIKPNVSVPFKVMGRPGTEALLMGCCICFHSEPRTYMAAGACQGDICLRQGAFIYRRKVIEAAAHRAQATAEWLDTHEFLPQAELSQWVDVVSSQNTFHPGFLSL